MSAAPVRLDERSRLRAALLRGSAGSIYVCGTPGVGKTVCVGGVVRAVVEEGLVEKGVLVNCAGFFKPAEFYEAVACSLGVDGGLEGVLEFAKAEGRRAVLVLDEVDFLGQGLMYEVFGWPRVAGSRLSVVGVANRLDLPVRMLPMLGRAGFMPEVVAFAPYCAQDLKAIVEARLAEGEIGCVGPLPGMAIGLAAKRVAAMSGDARRMLDVCREAVERCEGGSVGEAMQRVLGILDRGGRGNAAADTVRTLPTQHQLALCCVANAEKIAGKGKAGKAAGRATVGGLYEYFKQTCGKVAVAGVGLSDFVDILESLASVHGLVSISEKKKKGRAKKAFGPSAGGDLRSKVVGLDSVSVADVQNGCRESPLLKLLVGTEL